MKVELTADHIQYIRDVMELRGRWGMAEQVLNQLPVVTYSIGDRFTCVIGEQTIECMLVACDPKLVNMVALDDGSFVGYLTKVNSTRSITVDEFRVITKDVQQLTPLPKTHTIHCSDQLDDSEQTERLQLTIFAII